MTWRCGLRSCRRGLGSELQHVHLRGGGRDALLQHARAEQGVDERALARVELADDDDEKELVELFDRSRERRNAVGWGVEPAERSTAAPDRERRSSASSACSTSARIAVRMEVAAGYRIAADSICQSPPVLERLNVHSWLALIGLRRPILGDRWRSPGTLRARRRSWWPAVTPQSSSASEWDCRSVEGPRERAVVERGPDGFRGHRILAPDGRPRTRGAPGGSSPPRAAPQPPPSCGATLPTGAAAGDAAESRSRRPSGAVRALASSGTAGAVRHGCVPRPADEPTRQVHSWQLGIGQIRLAAGSSDGRPSEAECGAS